ncbi:MAG: type II secretion system GspH family protein [Acidobacteria bacterium]|nr:type II secretion system GspH family protein [Acidobacteriota bacterium]MDW7983991.1 type II secretion system protein [Acidobacteriota bacterium]
MREAAYRTQDARCRMQDAGFTLLELIVVLTILGLLVGVALPAYQRSVQKTKESVLKENLNRMRDVINQYYIDRRGECLQNEGDLVRLGYLRAIPKDPITQQALWDWVLEADPNDPSQMCIRDVRSLAPGRDSNGVPYRDY